MLNPALPCPAHAPYPQKLLTSSATLCNWMSQCGFPEGGSPYTNCTLYQEWAQFNGTTMPRDEQAAVCRTYAPGHECQE